MPDHPADAKTAGEATNLTCRLLPRDEQLETVAVVEHEMDPATRLADTPGR